MTAFSFVKLALDIVFMGVGAYLVFFFLREGIAFIIHLRRKRMIRKRKDKELLREICSRVNSVIEGRTELSGDERESLDRLHSRKNLSEEEKKTLTALSSASSSDRKQ